MYAPERSNKIELDEEIRFTTMELLYTHISQRVVEGLVWTRILAQLMLQTATSKEQTDWQKYPKNKKAIRINSPKQMRAKHGPPFQRRETDLCLYMLCPFNYFFANSFNSRPPAAGPAHSNSFYSEWRSKSRIESDVAKTVVVIWIAIGF